MRNEIISTFLFVKVKPERSLTSRPSPKNGPMPTAAYNGDRWLALEAVYGEGNVYSSPATGKDYAEIDKMNEAVMAAVNQSLRQGSCREKWPGL